MVPIMTIVFLLFTSVECAGAACDRGGSELYSLVLIVLGDRRLIVASRDQACRVASSVILEAGGKG